MQINLSKKICLLKGQIKIPKNYLCGHEKISPDSTEYKLRRLSKIDAPTRLRKFHRKYKNSYSTQKINEILENYLVAPEKKTGLF